MNSDTPSLSRKLDLLWALRAGSLGAGRAVPVSWANGEIELSQVLRALRSRYHGPSFSGHLG